MKEKKRKAVYDWLVEEGTPGSIASMLIYVLTSTQINFIIQDNNIKID